MVPATFTSIVSAAPVGAVPTATDTPVIVPAYGITIDATLVPGARIPVVAVVDGSARLISFGELYAVAMIVVL